MKDKFSFQTTKISCTMFSKALDDRSAVAHHLDGLSFLVNISNSFFISSSYFFNTSSVSDSNLKSMTLL